jgi:apolipoprotein N-acyltransferase
MTVRNVDSATSSDRWSYLWLAMGIVLLMLSTGRYGVALAAWLAPVFLLRFSRSRRRGRGNLWTLLGIYVAYGIAWSSILYPIFESWPLYLALVFVIALQNWLPFLLDRWLGRRLAGFSATLVFPLAVTALFFLNSLANPLGSFGTVGYEQYGNQALIQLASVTGLWGLTFLVSWFGAVANWAWERSFERPAIWRGACVYAAILGAALLFGGLRLAFAQLAPGTVRVHGVDRVGEADSAQQVNDEVIELTRREAARGAQIVFWGERAAGGSPAEADALVARAREVARQENIYLAIGVQSGFPEDERPMDNRLVVIAPSGEIVLEHMKYGATILFGDTTGDGILRTVDTPYGILTGIVCWDADFPAKVSRAGRLGADILLVANGEPVFEVAPLHAQQAIFRAIENGVSLVRQDGYRGISIATDPYGRLLARVDNRTTSDPVMVVQVPTQRVFTVYSVIGDLFGWLSVAGLVAAAAVAIVHRRTP